MIIYHYIPVNNKIILFELNLIMKPSLHFWSESYIDSHKLIILPEFWDIWTTFDAFPHVKIQKLGWEMYDTFPWPPPPVKNILGKFLICIDPRPPVGKCSKVLPCD